MEKRENSVEKEWYKASTDWAKIKQTLRQPIKCKANQIHAVDAHVHVPSKKASAGFSVYILKSFHDFSHLSQKYTYTPYHLLIEGEQLDTSQGEFSGDCQGVLFN